MKKVKITANGCAIFPTSSVIEVEGLIKPVKTVKNEVNGNNYLPPLTEFEEFTGQTTHFCTNCGKEYHEPENWDYRNHKLNFYSKFEEIIIEKDLDIGTCENCYNTLTKTNRL